VKKAVYREFTSAMEEHDFLQRHPEYRMVIPLDCDVETPSGRQYKPKSSVYSENNVAAVKAIYGWDGCSGVEYATVQDEDSDGSIINWVGWRIKTDSVHIEDEYSISDQETIPKVVEQLIQQEFDAGLWPFESYCWEDQKSYLEELIAVQLKIEIQAVDPMKDIKGLIKTYNRYIDVEEMVSVAVCVASPSQLKSFLDLPVDLTYSCYFYKAMTSGKLENCRFLLKQGASMEFLLRRVNPDDHDLLFLKFHECAFFESVWAIDERKAFYTIAAELGVDIDARDEGGNTALHYAAMNGNRELCMCLISLGADESAVNSDGLRAGCILDRFQRELAIRALMPF